MLTGETRNARRGLLNSDSDIYRQQQQKRENSHTIN